MSMVKCHFHSIEFDMIQHTLDWIFTHASAYKSLYTTINQVHNKIVLYQQISSYIEAASIQASGNDNAAGFIFIFGFMLMSK